MTWEQRMAEKSASRRSKQEAYWDEQAALLGQDYASTEDDYVNKVVADLTVEDALVMQDQMNNWGGACACIGGISCCIVRRRAIEQVLGDTK